MPWEQPLQQILQSIEGPVAKIMAVIIIIVTGLTLAFGDTSGGFRRLVQIVFGLSIAFAASSLLPVVLLLRRRSAGLMSEMILHDQVPGFEAPVHRALTEPILLGGAPRVVAITQRHARCCRWPGIAPLDRRPPAMGHRSSGGGLGGKARRAIRRCRAAASALSRASRRVKERHVQPC